MKTRNLLLSVAFLALLLQEAGAVVPSTADKAPQESKLTAPAAKNPESALKQTMSADAVLKIMGKPDVIRPMEAPDGKAEIWTYKRIVNERSTREQVGSTPIIVSVQQGDGTMRQYTTGENILYADVIYVTEETLELLLFNHKYLTQKISRKELKRLH